MTTPPCRVLLVEDEPVTAAVTRRMLEKSGKGRYAITHTASLTETLNAQRDQDFDVVLADLNLPDSHGLETTEAIVAADSEAAVIVLTANESEADGIRAVQLGAQDYLIKGAFSAESLNRSILYSIERHRLQRTIRQLAVIDELTGLYNRRGFNSLKDDMLQRARTSPHGGFLCYFDLDNFKLINDRMGHATGDEALKDFAAVLRRVFRKDSALIRLGGDEFVAIGLEGRSGLLQEYLQLLEALLHDRNRERPKDCRIQTSLGITTFDRRSKLNMDEVLATADKKLYDDKRRRHQADDAVVHFPGRASA
ncbi:MAG: diguanylate cyclase [Opitutaceae bacterium]